MNYNYVGSIAERKMHFSSSVEVIIDEKNELFHAISLYVPMSLAAANIVDFDPAWVSAEKPAVFTCVLDNYKENMKGRLLDQWADAFRQDTNTSLVLYVLVFLDDESTVNMWEIDDVSIKFAPITNTFNKLFFISYVKTLFDESYAGKPTIVPPTPGTTAAQTLRVTNTAGNEQTLTADTYVINDGVKTWQLVVAGDTVVPDGDHVDFVLNADTAGIDANMSVGTNELALFVSPPSGTWTAVCQEFTQGTDAEPEHEVPSLYFDMALALSYLCKLDLKLSYFIPLVKISYVDQKPNPADVCWIRLKTSAEEKEAMTSLKTGDRGRYFWGAQYLMNCVQNTWTLIHSESVNIIALAFAAWFAAKNGSGTYVGNKLSLLRLRGTRIKPLGFPSWLNSEINENDADGFDLLDAKNVGYLCTIADNTPQESCVSSARSINGTPVAAQMISKWVDYTSAQQCAKFITDDGTLTDPVLTDEDAYNKIQDIVFGNLLLFTSTKRINNIVMRFPAFKVAKTGMTKLEAASSWKAGYTDDLDEVTVTGGITAS
jgi:hypothetical protein